MRVIAVMSSKGGPGKSTTSVNLAAVLSKRYRVLLVDTDTQASAVDWCTRVGESLPFNFAHSVDPANLVRLKTANETDIVVVDTPGHDRDITVLEALLAPADYVVVPTEPSSLGVRPLVNTITRLVQPRGVPYRVLMNRVDPAGETSADVQSMRRLLGQRNIPYFEAFIRQYAVISRAPAKGQVVTMFGKDSSSQNALADYTKVAVELIADWAAMGRDPSDQGALGTVVADDE